MTITQSANKMMSLQNAGIASLIGTGVSSKHQPLVIPTHGGTRGYVTYQGKRSSKMPIERAQRMAARIQQRINSAA